MLLGCHLKLTGFLWERSQKLVAENDTYSKRNKNFYCDLLAMLKRLQCEMVGKRLSISLQKAGALLGCRPFCEAQFVLSAGTSWAQWQYFLELF